MKHDDRLELVWELSYLTGLLVYDMLPARAGTGPHGGRSFLPEYVDRPNQTYRDRELNDCGSTLKGLDSFMCD
jgi:hypothetical protein